MGGRNSTEVAFELPTQPSQFWCSAFRNIFSQKFQCCWDLLTANLVRARGKLVLQKREGLRWWKESLGIASWMEGCGFNPRCWPFFDINYIKLMFSVLVQCYKYWLKTGNLVFREASSCTNSQWIKYLSDIGVDLILTSSRAWVLDAYYWCCSEHMLMSL